MSLKAENVNEVIENIKKNEQIEEHHNQAVTTILTETSLLRDKSARLSDLLEEKEIEREQLEMAIATKREEIRFKQMEKQLIDAAQIKMRKTNEEKELLLEKTVEEAWNNRREHIKSIRDKINQLKSQTPNIEDMNHFKELLLGTFRLPKPVELENNDEEIGSDIEEEFMNFEELETLNELETQNLSLNQNQMSENSWPQQQYRSSSANGIRSAPARVSSSDGEIPPPRFTPPSQRPPRSSSLPTNYNPQTSKSVVKPPQLSKFTPKTTGFVSAKSQLTTPYQPNQSASFQPKLSTNQSSLPNYSTNQNPVSKNSTNQNSLPNYSTNQKPVSKYSTNQSSLPNYLTNQTPVSKYSTNQNSVPNSFNSQSNNGSFPTNKVAKPNYSMNRHPVASYTDGGISKSDSLHQSSIKSYLRNPTQNVTSNQNPVSSYSTNKSSMSNMPANRNLESKQLSNQRSGIGNSTNQNYATYNTANRNPSFANQNSTSNYSANRSSGSNIPANRNPVSSFSTNQGPQGNFSTNKSPASNLSANSSSSFNVPANQSAASNSPANKSFTFKKPSMANTARGGGNTTTNFKQNKYPSPSYEISDSQASSYHPPSNQPDKFVKPDSSPTQSPSMYDHYYEDCPRIGQNVMQNSGGRSQKYRQEQNFQKATKSSFVQKCSQNLEDFSEQDFENAEENYRLDSRQNFNDNPSNSKTTGFVPKQPVNYRSLNNQPKKCKYEE